MKIGATINTNVSVIQLTVNFPAIAPGTPHMQKHLIASIILGCAWVLWSETSHMSKTADPLYMTSWAVKSAHERLDDCHAAQRQMLAEDDSAVQATLRVTRVKQTADARVYQNADRTEGWTFRYVCLTNSIDPREPKGAAK
jgi:hypothetical protein